jgi:addiction module HigA family antidote
MKSLPPTHPGRFLRHSVLKPRKLTVSAAAKLIGIGRPALSNFVNGHVSVSPEMAARVQVAFGIPAAKLLEMQVAYDAAVAVSSDAPVKALPYVAPLLEIKATEIEQWVERNLSARARLAVLLRTLVNSTVAGAKRVDFPGNDDSQRPGWDGFVESERHSQWVPQGSSGWEFGTNADVREKAEADFDSRVRGLTSTELSQTTFVFVTPRHWPGKDKWVSEKRALKLWNDVRAYDSSDLEQWLEQSVQAQAWFSNETSRPTDGVRCLDKCWDDWSNVGATPLAASLFDSAVSVAASTIKSRLSQPPGDPITIAADSAEEGLAFLAQLFGPSGGVELEVLRDRALVFDTPGVVPRLAQGNGGFIAITANRSVERELGPYSASIHSILIYPRNTSNVEPLVVLEPLGFQAFEEAMKAMGFGREDILRYSGESGRSLTVLRRRLATHPAVRTPVWAEQHDTSRSLVPFMLIGAWSSTNPADRVVLSLQAGVDSYDTLETVCQRLANLNDAPIWSVGAARGVVSKIDLLFAVASTVTEQDLRRFFEISKLVLGEDDPRLDLPETDRWAAAIFGKSRDLSGSLRRGIAETLVLLSVHGNRLFRDRIDVDCEAAATRIVQELLTPLTSRILEANDRELTDYAEAAPEAFLSLLEDDLATDRPEIFKVLRSVGSGFLTACPRTGLLWSLESLAWSTRTLPRAALILARLAEIEINDNWANKPIRSLEMIFDARMPQTSADHNARLSALMLIAERHPSVAWQLCVSQLGKSHWIGNYSHKPRWRNEAFGFGEPFKTWEPILAFVRPMVELLLKWRGAYTQEMICDLVGCLRNFSKEHQESVWTLIRSWNSSEASDHDRSVVRDEIRRVLLSGRGRLRENSGEDTTATLAATARKVFVELEPRDVVHRHEWLFRDQWIDLSIERDEAEEPDFAARDQRVAALRASALREVLKSRGTSGIIALSRQGKASSVIGWIAAKEIFTRGELIDFVLDVFNSGTDEDRASRHDIISGALRATHGGDALTQLLERARETLPASDLATLILLTPFRREVWQWVDGLEQSIRTVYWAAAVPEWIRDSPDESREAMERLLRAKRPRAAFACSKWQIGELDVDLVYRVLSEIAAGGDEEPGSYQLDSHDVEEAFILIDGSPELTLDQKAVLEFAFLEALADSLGPRGRHGIPNLEKYVEKNPGFFVQNIVWVYKRRGEGEDPSDLLPAPEHRKNFAERGHKLLNSLSSVPGRNSAGEIVPRRLASWIQEVREGCEKVERLEVGDICIGELLSSAPAGADGIWPCEAVRVVLEGVRSKDMLRGMATGRYNSRGVTWRGEGGDQERALASQYQQWADAVRFAHPFVASELLEQMSDGYRREADREDTEARVRRRRG